MIAINSGKCTSCGSCVNECHRQALDFIDGELKWDSKKCYGCGHCMALCPTDALMLDGDGYDINDVEEFNFAARAKAEQIRELVMMKRSVRQFTDADVSEDDLATVLEAGKYSPTAENKQGNVFLVITSPDKQKEFLDSAMDVLDGMCDEVLEGKSTRYSKILAERLKEVAADWNSEGIDGLFYNAPAYIFVFSDTVHDGVIAACQMSNMAYGLRLGTCYIRIGADIFENEGLRKQYGIPEEKVPAMAIALGEPDVEFFCTVPRKNPEVIIL